MMKRRRLAAPFVFTASLAAPAAAHPPPAEGAAPAKPAPTLPAARFGARVQERDDGTCWERHTMKCPEGVKCNPPPPRQVKCLPAPSPGGKVSADANGTCWQTFSVECEPGATCNPPPPRQVKCPK
jgi:hypothetical protein